MRHLTMYLLCVMSIVAGCAEQPKKEAAPAAAHSHGSGPHGGVVTDWGGEYHVEFTVDHDAQQATVYILGGDAETPAPIAVEKLQLSIHEPSFQVELVAQPLEGEPAGSSSRFVGKHEKLGQVQDFAGTISGEIDGTPYAGDFHE